MIDKACTKLAEHQELSTELMFYTADGIVWMEAAGERAEEAARAFISLNPQYCITPFPSEMPGPHYVVTLYTTELFDAVLGDTKKYCERCGYDRFEIVTVMRRTASIGKTCFLASSLLSKDHMSTCMACERKAIEEFP